MKIIYFLLTCCYSYLNLEWEIERKFDIQVLLLQWCISQSVFWAFPFPPPKSFAKEFLYRRKEKKWRLKRNKESKKIWKHFLAEWELVTTMFPYIERAHGFKSWIVYWTGKKKKFKIIEIKPKLNCDYVIINLIII